MIEILDRRIKQMHEALGDVIESDLSAIVVDRRSTAAGFYCELDYSGGMTDIGLMNIADSLVANIACLKDHLKIWCRKTGKTFEGDDLISSDKNVALVHDLWNIAKHVELDRAPRSGHRPRIKNLKRIMRLSSGGQPGAFSSFMFDPFTGQKWVNTQKGGSVSLVITGAVVDEHDTILGDFASICEAAAAAWQDALLQAGVPLPTP